MSTRSLGILIFSLLSVGVSAIAVVCLLNHIASASAGGGMKSVAGGFVVLMSIIPLGVILVILVLFLLIFLAFRSRHR